MTTNIGAGHQSLMKFACVIYKLPSLKMLTGIMFKLCMMQLNTLLRKVSKAANKVKEFYEPDEERIYNIVVSGGGTWGKRGFSSSFGVITVLSTVTGKALDCEIMSKECPECKLRRGKEGTEEFQQWWEQHQHRCNANLLVLLGLWILQACLQYSKGQLNSTM